MRGGPKLIQSRDNPQVKALLKLAGSSRERRSTGTTLLEGERLVRAFQESGGIAETIFAGESALARPAVRSLVENAPARTRLVLADRLVGQISQLVSSAGVGAVVRTPERISPPRTLSNCVLLENIQDPGNLGSILRSVVAAGIPHVFLSSGSVFAWSPKVIRAAMGAHFFVSIFEEIDLSGVMRGFGGRVVAMDPHAETSLYDLDVRGPVAWVFGNEGAGLSASVRHMATDHVRVPMPGPTESLNVAAAAAVCLFEQVRQGKV